MSKFFLFNRENCLLVEQEDMHVFLFSKRTCLSFDQQEDMHVFLLNN